jgi:hypothetical protein
MPRTKGAKNISPWDHECLIRDYVVGDKSVPEIAAEYGYAEQTIYLHRAAHKAEIAAVTAGMVEEFSYLWGAKLKDHVRLLTSRLRKIWRQMDLLEEHAARETETMRAIDPDASEVPYNSREYLAYQKAEQSLSHQILEITGQLMSRAHPVDAAEGRNPLTDFELLVEDADGNLYPVQGRGGAASNVAGMGGVPQ